MTRSGRARPVCDGGRGSGIAGGLAARCRGSRRRRGAVRGSARDPPLARAPVARGRRGPGPGVHREGRAGVRTRRADADSLLSGRGREKQPQDGGFYYPDLRDQRPGQQTSVRGDVCQGPNHQLSCWQLNHLVDSSNTDQCFCFPSTTSQTTEYIFCCLHLFE